MEKRGNTVSNTVKQRSNWLRLVLKGLVGTLGGFSILLGLLVVIPLTLWFAWKNHTSPVNSILVTLFCLSFGWALLSLALFLRGFKELGLDGEERLRLFSGPRPSDPDELCAWQLGWNFMIAVLAVILCMFAIPFASWLSGK